MIRRALFSLIALVAGAAVVWRSLVNHNGDSHMVWDDRLDAVRREGDGLSATVGISNRGNALGVVRRVDGRIVAGGPGRVLATLKGSRPPERGWWVSNILKPGESCTAEVDVMPDSLSDGPLTIELTIQEMGRRVFQYRTARFTLSDSA